MASLFRGVFARGIARNFSCSPVADPLLRGIRVHRQFLDARIFSSAPVSNNVNSESDFFSQLEKDRKVSILGIEWKLTFNQVMACKFKGSNLPPLNPPGCQSNPTKHQINLSASSLVKYVDRLLNDEPSCDILYGAMYMVYTDPRFQTYNEFAKMKVLSKLLDVIEHYPEAKWQEVYLMRGRIKSCTLDDSRDLLSEEQVVSRVIDVVNSYLLEIPYIVRVTRRTHFYKNLRLNRIAHKCVIAALESEFKMYVPQNVDSCERAIGYIYHNQQQRMSLQEFRDRFCYANILKERFILRFIKSGKSCVDVAPKLAIYGSLFILLLNR